MRQHFKVAKIQMKRGFGMRVELDKLYVQQTPPFFGNGVVLEAKSFLGGQALLCMQEIYYNEVLWKPYLAEFYTFEENGQYGVAMIESLMPLATTRDTILTYIRRNVTGYDAQSIVQFIKHMNETYGCSSEVMLSINSWGLASDGSLKLKHYGILAEVYEYSKHRNFDHNARSVPVESRWF